MTPLGRELADISAREMVSALGASNAPKMLRRCLELPFFAASRGLGETLAALQADVGALGLPRAAERALSRCGATLQVSGVSVGTGPRLVLANHPGAYDALALMRAIDRRDLAILAADRDFLRALSGMSAHFLFVGEQPAARASALKRSLAWLRKGGALLHFPAGRIEPDADFVGSRHSLLEPWQAGVSVLVKACARADGRVLLAGVRGVHSPRAKRLFLNRLAERRGITTLSPLVQLVAKLRDVRARVRVSDAPAGLFDLPPEQQERALRQALISAISAA